MDQLEKIEAMLEYQYLSTNYMHCMQQEQYNIQRIQKHPGHIGAMSELEKIRNDMAILANAMSPLQGDLLHQLEEETGEQFKYLIKRNAEQSNNNGKTISFNPKKGEGEEK